MTLEYQIIKEAIEIIKEEMIERNIKSKVIKEQLRIIKKTIKEQE